jgi:hypothetical protein
MNIELENKVKTIAEKVLNQTTWPKSENYGSVIAILMVVSIILTSIRILQECKKNRKFSSQTEKYQTYKQEIKEVSRTRSWFTKLGLKKIIRKELGKDEYKQYGNELLYAILNIGDTLTDEEAITLVEAANV